MENNQGAKIPESKVTGKNLWIRTKKYSVYAVSIIGALATCIVIVRFILDNHKHPDISGEWRFKFSIANTDSINLKGLQRFYDVSLRQSGTRNENVEGSGNYCKTIG